MGIICSTEVSIDSAVKPLFYVSGIYVTSERLMSSQTNANYWHLWMKETLFTSSKVEHLTAEELDTVENRLWQFRRSQLSSIHPLFPSLLNCKRQWNVWRQQLAQLNYSKHANCIVAKWGLEHDYARIFLLYSASTTFNLDQLCFLSFSFSFLSFLFFLLLVFIYTFMTLTKAVIWSRIRPQKSDVLFNYIAS